MTSLVKDSATPTLENVPKASTSSTMLDFTLVVPLDIIPPMLVIENVPAAEPNPQLGLQMSEKAEASSPPKVKVAKRKGKTV